MKKALLIIFCLFLCSCVNRSVPLLGTGQSGTDGLPADQLSFAKFKDIPIPEGAIMDMENTVIFDRNGTVSIEKGAVSIANSRAAESKNRRIQK